MRFSRPVGGIIELPESAVKTLLDERQLKPSAPESGGILLGRSIINSADFVIDEARLPMKGDRQSRTNFYRHHLLAQLVIFQAWLGSGGTKNYLGDWHTHPEPIPTPSGQDRRNWQNIAAKKYFGYSELLFIIVGQEQVGIWEVDSSGVIQNLVKV